MMPAAPIEPQIYVPHTQMPWFALGLLLRVDGPIAPVLDQTRRFALELQPEIVIDQVHELAQARRETLAQPRSSALMLGLFAGAATLVAGLGLYALLRYQVVARHRELSVRAALGATREELVRGVVAQGLVLVGAGLVGRSFWRLQQVDPGFRSEQVLVVDLQLPASRYAPDSVVPTPAIWSDQM